MQRELESQPAWFIARSSIYRGPVGVVIAREEGAFRVLAVGIWDYELALVETTAETFFRSVEAEAPAGGFAVEAASELGTPEILLPANDKVIGNDAFKVQWRVQGAGKDDNFYSVALGSAGMMTLKRLEPARSLRNPCVARLSLPFGISPAMDVFDSPTQSGCNTILVGLRQRLATWAIKRATKSSEFGSEE